MYLCNSYPHSFDPQAFARKHVLHPPNDKTPVSLVLHVDQDNEQDVDDGSFAGFPTIVYARVLSNNKERLGTLLDSLPYIPNSHLEKAEKRSWIQYQRAVQ